MIAGVAVPRITMIVPDLAAAIEGFELMDDVDTGVVFRLVSRAGMNGPACEQRDSILMPARLPRRLARWFLSMYKAASGFFAILHGLHDVHDLSYG